MANQDAERNPAPREEPWQAASSRDEFLMGLTEGGSPDAAYPRDFHAPREDESWMS